MVWFPPPHTTHTLKLSVIFELTRNKLFAISSYYYHSFCVFFFFFTRLWSLQKIPSGGIVVFTVAMSFCRRISLYGFYPFYNDPLTKETLPYHYYDRNKINLNVPRLHDMPEEYQIFKELNSTGQIRLVTKCTQVLKM